MCLKTTPRCTRSRDPERPGWRCCCASPASNRILQELLLLACMLVIKVWRVCLVRTPLCRTTCLAGPHAGGRTPCRPTLRPHAPAAAPAWCHPYMALYAQGIHPAAFCGVRKEECGQGMPGEHTCMPPLPLLPTAHTCTCTRACACICTCSGRQLSPSQEPPHPCVRMPPCADPDGWPGCAPAVAAAQTWRRQAKSSPHPPLPWA